MDTLVPTTSSSGWIDGELMSPSRVLIVDTVMDEEMLRVDVPAPTTRVRIWTNGHRAADNVVIGLD
jgi:hypothetical protein